MCMSKQEAKYIAHFCLFFVVQVLVTCSVVLINIFDNRSFRRFGMLAV